MINFRSLKRAIEKRRFLKVIFLCFLIPIFVMMVSAFLIYNNYKNLFQSELKSNYVSNLSALAENVDSSLNELQSTTLLLSSDSNLYDIFYNSDKLNALDSYKINAMTSSLVKFKATKSLIDSVYILHKASNEILDISGTMDADSFYTRFSKYNNYNKDFWMNLKIKTNFYQILDPSLLENDSYDMPSKRSVIPFVTSNIESFRSNNLFVINISVNAITDLLNKYKFLPSSKLCIINNEGIVFSSTEPNLTNTISADKNFLSRITDSNNNFFEYNINGSRNLVVSYTSNSAKFNDFVYVAFIPYNDFYQKLSNIKNLAYSIIFLSVIFSIVLAFLASRKIYTPIDNLVGIISKENPDASLSFSSEFDYLNSQVNRILTNENNLKKDLSLVLPFASEHYITKILTNNDFLLDKGVKSFIQSNHVNFKYSGFNVSIFELSFTEKYFDIYNNEDYLTLTKAVTKLLNDISCGEYPTYMLSLNKNKFAVLLNLPETASLENIMFNIRDMVDLFHYDKDLLTITVGIGRTYSDYTGMNQSYNEAIKALSSLSPLSSEKVKIYSDVPHHTAYNYSINDENKLYNYLTGFYKEEAMSFINSLIQRLYQGAPSEIDVKKFYSNIYNTILRVSEEKKINLSELLGRDYIDIVSELEILSTVDINNYVLLLVDKLSSINKSSSKLDIIQITDYIKEHFQEDIYLEKIAELFSTSDKYLSRLFKESLGIGYHEYLISLRVSESKKLLTDTDLSIAKVGEMAGFATSSTFFRIFKKLEGVTPSQYRDNIKK